MGRTQLVALILLGFWGTVAVGRVCAQARLERVEAAWVQANLSGSRARLEGDLKALGAISATVNGACEVTYVGSADGWAKVVNRLLREPQAWKIWQTKIDAEGRVEGRVGL